MRYVLILAIIFSCSKKQEVKKKDNIVYHEIDPVIKIGDCKVVKSIHATGVKVILFKNGNHTLSKMPLKTASSEAIDQELKELRDLGLCE